MSSRARPMNPALDTPRGTPGAGGFRRFFRPFAAPISTLVRRAGRARGAERGFFGLEPLEGRVLLGGDHPSFTDVFRTLAPLPSSLVTLAFDGQGRGTANGAINPGMDNDIFRFIADQADFITILADTINAGGPTPRLDSRVVVYTRDPLTTQETIVAQGTSSGTLTSGTNTDGWTGFVAVPGREYFVQVASDKGSGAGSTGNYVLRVARASQPIDPPGIDPDTGAGAVFGQAITTVGTDLVFKFTTPNDPKFNGVGTLDVALDVAASSQLDTRVDVYSAVGTLIAADSETGHLNNAFAAFAVRANSTYYVRIRSDSFSLTNPTAVGGFALTIDVAADELIVDPVTRLAGVNNILGGGDVWTLLKFKSQGTGLTFLTAVPGSAPIPQPDPAVRLYNAQPSLIAFNDDFSGTSAEIQVQLTGGTTYWVVVEAFDTAGAGTINFRVESEHTFDNNLPVDDHVNTPDPGGTADQIRRAAEQATPLVWGQPQLYQDPASLPVRDHSFFTQAVGQGRLWGNGDTDLFQFTPPVDMVGSYAGDNDDAGTSLYVGGGFTQAGWIAQGVVPEAFRIAAWDAGQWFPARRGVDGPVYAAASYDPPGPAPLALYIAGDFRFARNTANPLEDIRVNGLARFYFEPLVGDYIFSAVGTGLGDTGIGRALTVFDPPDLDGSGGAPDPTPVLVVGGTFTQPGANIASWNGATFATLGAGTNNTVYALSDFDPSDPDPPSGPTPDPLNYLVVGGAFTQAGGQARDHIAVWSGSGWATPGYQPPVPPPPPPPGPQIIPQTSLGVGVNGVNDIVYSLTQFQRPTPVGPPGPPPPPPPNQIIIGGAFTTAGGVARSKIAAFDGYTWQTMGAGATGGTAPTVYALSSYDPVDPDGSGPAPDLPNTLIAGGDFTTMGGVAASNIARWSGTGWTAMGDGMNDTVRALTSFGDDDPAAGLYGGDVGRLGPVLYAGGDFTNADGNPVGRAARWDWDPINTDYFWFGLGAKRQIQAVPPADSLGANDSVFALAEFDDGNPGTWDRNDRPSSRAAIVLAPVTGAFVNTFIRIYDSNFNEIYSNETIAPPFPDPSGSIDPSLGIGTPAEFVAPPMFGGEVYYIEVSGSGGGGTGRYSLSVVVDAFVKDDSISAYGEPAEEGDFANASQLILSTGTGDQRTFIQQVNSAYQGRSFVTKGEGFDITELMEYSGIESITDTDLWTFRAPSSGTTEVRINTTNIVDQHAQFGVGASPVVTNRAAPGSRSPLDAVIEIYNNDFELIASNDDAAEIKGERSPGEFVGEFANRTFFGRDPRVVFDVQPSTVYFILIKSGQKAAFDAGNLSEVDWRRAIGSYEMMVNSMPNLAFDDDHEDAQGPQSTPIVMDSRPTSPTNGTGEIRGVIKDTAFNPDDIDLFNFISPGSGTAQIDVFAGDGSSQLDATVSVFDEGGQLVGQRVGSVVSGPVTVRVVAQKGQRFYVAVDSNVPAPAGESYRLRISGLPYMDDFGSLAKFSNSSVIDKNLYDYDGFESVDGKIEYAGDTDLFKFETTIYDRVSVTVEAAPGFDPIVTVYEVSVDPAGNPILLRVAFNDDAFLPPRPGAPVVADPSSQVQFPITAPDRTYIGPPSAGPFNFYYILVQGVDPDRDAGNYKLTLNILTTDDHPDQTQFALADRDSAIVITGPTGAGDASGVVELIGDTDLFRFTSPAAGRATITLTSPAESALLPRIKVFGPGPSFTQLQEILTSQTSVTGPDASVSQAIFRFTAARDTKYYILVEGVAGGTVKTADTGAYTINVAAPTLDDHANESEFAFATPIPLSIVTGDGLATGEIEIPSDTDLFRFDTLNVGKYTITIATPNSFFRPIIKLIKETSIGEPSEIVVRDGDAGDEDGAQDGSVTASITAVAVPPPAERWFVLVAPDQAAPFPFGRYSVTVFGPPPVHTPADDHADSGDFDNASIISLDSRTGEGNGFGGLQFTGDTDLFQFASLAAGRAFVQIVTPKGQVLDFKVRIFGPDRTEIAQDSAGIPGANANVSFPVARGSDRYWIDVSSIPAGTGNYTVKVKVAPETFFLYFPEGFASSSIREYVSIANANATAVRYTVKVAYENGDPESVLVSDGTIAAGSRGGLTLSDGERGAFAGLRTGTPYSIIIESDAPLGASFSHYDFGATLGESFTERTSTTWSFARGERNPNLVNDFIVVYNPNASATVVTLTAYPVEGGSPIAITRTIEGFRRGGFELNALSELPIGAQFAFVLTSAPAVSGQAHRGVVAAQSHYDLVSQSGYSILGNPDGGATDSIIPSLTNGSTSTASVTIFSSATDAIAVETTVTITGSYITPGIPGFTRTITLSQKGSTTLTGDELGLAPNQAVGLRFSANRGITVLASEQKLGEANAIQATSTTGTTWFFGDAFINARRAGNLYFENLALYNPDVASSSLPVTVTLLFTDGTSADLPTINVSGQQFASIDLHRQAAILDRGGLQFYSIRVSAPTPLIAELTHYDLVLRGGWSNTGASLGLTNPLSTI